MKKKWTKLSVRDYEILLFLWRWKVATTSVIEQKFYPASKGLAAYYRLWRLERSGFVVGRCTVDRNHNFWMLSDKGFAAIKSELPPLIEEGYKPEKIKHDLIVSAVHLGDWLCEQPENIALYSEQELRRIDPKHYPSWVPKSKIHRSDGYWYINDGKANRLLALEVELSQKRLDNYNRVARFYAEDTRVDQVLWIVKNMQYAGSIHKRITDAIGSDENIHSFILLNDFMNGQWQSKIVAGKDIGLTIQNLLARTPQECRKTLCRDAFFDTRKIPIKSATHKNLETLIFIN